ncbi:MAG: thiamine phosphate synthase [Candidatus Latescibacteria bacterium]|nr:thiamine phosphate synthase [Candidatus Latescibacterota bacterium]
MLNIKNQIIDVNFNRVSEGIKAIEDLIRFYFQDQQSLHRIRKAKQNLWKNFSTLRKQVVFSRQSEKDLGRKIRFDIHKRGNIVDILTVNFKRSQEASRILEELFKLINTKHAGFFKDLRFTLYDLEKRLFVQMKPEFNPQLYVIIDIKTVGRKNLAKITRVCLQGGATMFQLRETERATTRQWLSSARQIQKALINAKAKFIINNRTDIALAVSADGVHLGSNDMPIKKAKELLGESKIIGITVRNIKQALQVEKQNAQYVGVGSIFQSSTKANAPVVGLKILQQIVKAVKIPVVAIGGINRQNIGDVIQTGTTGIAVVSAIFQGADFHKPGFNKIIINNLKKIRTYIKQ